MSTAFEVARAGGVVDTAVGIPKTREDMYEFYEFIRRQTRDTESRDGDGALEFPAGYMFKDVPKWDDDELADPGRRVGQPGRGLWSESLVVVVMAADDDVSPIVVEVLP